MGCAASQDTVPVGKLKITKEVWENYKMYVRDMGARNIGAYAVSLDGEKYYAVWCDGMSCGGPTHRQEALKGCERNGRKCVIFAYRKDILVDYEVMP
jgi:hypothetical protein